MNKIFWRSIFLGIALSILGAGCGSLIQILPPIFGLIIFPERVVVASGATITYSARQLIDGQLGSTVPARWQLVGDVGAINSNGVFTATKVGVGTVVASYEASGASAHVWVASGVLASLSITPETYSLQAGQNQKFTAVGHDSGGNVLTVPVSFEVVSNEAEIDIGSVDAGGLFSARKVGSGVVRAYAGDITAAAKITVRAGELARIDVSAVSASLRAGDTQQYRASGFDAYDNPILLSPLWSLSAPRGEISASGLFLAKYVGGTDVIATEGSMSGRTSVTVSAGPAATITITPDVRVVNLRDSVLFAAAVKDTYGNSVSQDTLSWSVEGDIGIVDTAGNFTAKRLGVGTIRARVNTFTGLASVQVVMGPDFFERELAGITIGETFDSVRDRVGGVTLLSDVGGVQIYRAGNGVVLEVTSGTIRTIEISGSLTFRAEGGVGIGDDILSVIRDYGKPDFIGTDSGGRGSYFFPGRGLRVWTRNGDVVTFNITYPNFIVPAPISPSAIRPLSSL